MTTYTRLLKRITKTFDDIEEKGKTKVRIARHKDAIKRLAKYAKTQRLDLKSSFKKEQLAADNNGTVFVSKPQKNAAKKIVEHFTTGKQLVTLIAEPQWGKTGTILAAAYYLCIADNDYTMTDSDQVYIITGLSDTGWEEQTKSRMLPQFRHNVYHRGRVGKIIPQLAKAHNALIIVDECHYASGTEQTLKKVFEEAGLLDIDTLIDRNIKILQTSATPDNVLLDSNSWGEYHAIVKPPRKSKTYTSFKDLLDNDCLYDSLDLADPGGAETLFEHITSFDEPRYHIIRLPRRGEKGNREDIEDNIIAFCEDYNINMLYYDSDNKVDDIDEILNTKPDEHLIILIVDFWRAAKTLVDDHLGVLHERMVRKPNSTTVVQSLAGRCVGHNKNMIDGPKIFTHLKAVEEYIELCDKEFDYTDTKYYSTGISSNGEGRVTAKESYAHECVGVEHKYIEKHNAYGWKLFYGTKKVSPYLQAKRFVKKHLGRDMPEKKKNADGFYVQNDVIDDPLYVYDKYFTDDQPTNTRIFKGLSGNNAKKKTNWRQYALYFDPDDNTSLVWFVCWRKNAFK